MTLRDQARQYVIDSVREAAAYSHYRNYNKLHVRRDGTVSWFESINQSDDIIDEQADGFAAIPSVITVGTGSYVCNCDHCMDSGYETQADAVSDAVADSDLSDMQEQMLEEFDRIEQGYFDDEEEGEMETVTAFQWATSWGMYIIEARHPQPGECTDHINRDSLLIGVKDGRYIELEHFGWRDIDTVFRDRKPTHYFNGCNNMAWIVTPEEEAAILKIENDRREAAAAKKRAEEEAEKSASDAIYAKAKETGVDQVLEKWMADCDGTAVECSFDACARLVRPDGSTYIVRDHCH